LTHSLTHEQTNEQTKQVLTVFINGSLNRLFRFVQRETLTLTKQLCGGALLVKITLLPILCKICFYMVFDHESNHFYFFSPHKS